MDIKTNIVINSHLSDALIEINHQPELAADRIRFVKKLLALRDAGQIGQEVPKEFLNHLWQEVTSTFNEKI